MAIEGIDTDVSEIGWQQTFDAVMDVIALISNDYCFLKMNKAGLKGLEKTPDEVIGKKCYELVHGLTEPIAGCPCKNMVKNNVAGSGEISDHGRQYLATASPIFGKNNEMVAFTHTIKDITELKEAQNVLKTANELLESEVEKRTAELKITNKQLLKEIDNRNRSESALKVSEALLQKQKSILEKKNIALKEIINQIESEKGKIKEEIKQNIDFLVKPVVDKLEIEKRNTQTVHLLRHHLEKMTSSFGKSITDRMFHLTFSEINICGMIRSGLQSKDIAKMLNISVKTVNRHRKNIRQKLDLSNKKVNLAAYLRNL